MPRPFLAAVFSLLVSSIAPSRPAAAQEVAAGPPARDSLHLTFGIGPSLGVSNFGITQAKLVQELGLRLGGGGLVLGLALGESFGDRVFVFQVGGRLGWETAVALGTSKLVIAPSVLAGMFYVDVDAGLWGNASDAFFDLQFALDLHLPLGGAWGLFARPLALDVVFGEHDVAIRYDLIVGAAARF